MKIERADYDSVAYVAERMRESDYEELMATCWCSGRAELAAYIAAGIAGTPSGVTVFAGADPVAAGALIEHRPNVLTLGFFARPEFVLVARPLTRHIKQKMLAPAIARGVHRIEAASLATHADAHKWLQALGLGVESLSPKFGRNGEDFVQFAWVK